MSEENKGLADSAEKEMKRVLNIMRDNGYVVFSISYKDDPYVQGVVGHGPVMSLDIANRTDI